MFLLISPKVSNLKIILRKYAKANTLNESPSLVPVDFVFSFNTQNYREYYILCYFYFNNLMNVHY